MKEAYTATLNTLGIGNSEVMDQIEASSTIFDLKAAFMALSNCTGAIPKEPNFEDEPAKKSKSEVFI